jgi:hypothetical protein
MGPNRSGVPADGRLLRWMAAWAALARLLSRLKANAEGTDWMRPRCCRAGRPAGRL